VDVEAGGPFVSRKGLIAAVVATKLQGSGLTPFKRRQDNRRTLDRAALGATDVIHLGQQTYLTTFDAVSAQTNDATL
jgi:hypothetical protein